MPAKKLPTEVVDKAVDNFVERVNLQQKTNWSFFVQQKILWRQINKIIKGCGKVIASVKTP